MSYDDIIAKIKSDLTGNKDNDKDYIINQFKVFNSKEIHLELGRLLWDLMSDEEQNAYKKAVIQDIPVDEFIKSVYSYLNYGDFETALKELEDLWKFYHLNLGKILNLIIFTLIILWKRSYSGNILKHQKK